MFLYTIIDGFRRFYLEPLAKSTHDLQSWLNWIPEGVKSEGLERMEAWIQVVERLSRNYEKPEWNVKHEDKKVKEELVWSQNAFGRLIRFNVMKNDNHVVPKLLIVTPYSGHYGTLLRETVERMVKGADVYVLEWNNVRDISWTEGDFSLDDYIDQVIGAIRFLKGRDSRKLHIMSVCQPTVPVLVASTLMKQRGEEGPDNLIMIGGPIDARKSPTATNNFALEHDLNWFKKNLIHMIPYPYKGFGRMVYPGFLQYMGFVAMNPSRHMEAHHEFFNNLLKGDERSVTKHKEFYNEYNAVMDLPGQYYLQTIEKVFLNFDLAVGNFKYRDEILIKPEVLNCHLMTLEGELDDISGAGQTHSAQDLCTGIQKNRRKVLTAKGVGHYGVFSGSKFKETIAPEIEKWILKVENE